MQSNNVNNQSVNNTVVVVTSDTQINVTQPIVNVVEVATLGPQGPPGSGGGITNTGSFAVTGSNLFTNNQIIRSGSNQPGFSSAIKFENLGQARYTAGISGSTFVIANTNPTSDVWTNPTIVKLQIGDTTSTFNTDLTVTGSINSTNGFVGNVTGTSSWAYSASQAVSSSYSLISNQSNTASFLPPGTYQITSSNANQANTASYVNLIEGPGISINQLTITSSVRQVNGIFPTNGNIATTLTSVTTGTSASLILSSSGTVTGSLTNGLVWIIANNTPDTTKNGNAYIFASSSVGQWYSLSGYDTATYDSRYLKLTPQSALAGALDLGTNNITNIGLMQGTASWAQSSSNSVTASYVTSSNIYGPYGSNSILSSSYSATSSYALNSNVSLSNNVKGYFLLASGTPSIEGTSNLLLSESYYFDGIFYTSSYIQLKTSLVNSGSIYNLYNGFGTIDPTLISSSTTPIYNNTLTFGVGLTSSNNDFFRPQCQIIFGKYNDTGYLTSPYNGQFIAGGDIFTIGNGSATGPNNALTIYPQSLVDSSFIDYAIHLGGRTHIHNHLKVSNGVEIGSGYDLTIINGALITNTIKSYGNLNITGSTINITGNTINITGNTNITGSLIVSDLIYGTCTNVVIPGGYGSILMKDAGVNNIAISPILYDFSTNVSISKTLLVDNAPIQDIRTISSINYCGTPVYLGGFNLTSQDADDSGLYNDDGYAIASNNSITGLFSYGNNNLTVGSGLINAYYPINATQGITGSLLGTASTASYVNLIEGPGIKINGLTITSSLRTVNGILPTNGNIATTLTAVITGDSSSLIQSSSGTITGSITNGTVWIISNNTPDPTKNGNSYIFASSSVGQWYSLSGYDTATYDSRYLKLTPQSALAGNLNLGGNNITNIGLVQGTASWAQSSSQALTASYALNISNAPKAGNVVFSSFGGIPLSSSITFTTPFPANTYAVTVTGEDARSWAISSKTSAGFTINSNSSVALTGNTYWTAIINNS